MSIIWWTDEQKELLIKLYPSTDKKEILKALKPKTWYAIKKEANELGLIRTALNMGRHKKKPKQFLGQKQLTTQNKRLIEKS